MDAMRRGLGLDVIEVQKAELLAKLKANLDRHMLDYERAMEGFKVDAIRQLREALVDAEGVGVLPDRITFDKPKHHHEEYTTVIEMLEMAVGETLHVTADQFKCYVQDNWQWKKNFVDALTKYGR